MTFGFRIACVATLFAAIASVGCNTAPKYTFTISLKNASTQPVTAWLTKSGGPDEDDWLAPEDLATSRAATVDQINGTVIPGGKTGTIGPIAGRFDADSVAMLRIYAGKLSLDQILATKADGKLRVDVPLRDGVNHLVVSPTLPLQIDRESDSK